MKRFNTETDTVVFVYIQKKGKDEKLLKTLSTRAVNEHSATNFSFFKSLNENGFSLTQPLFVVLNATISLNNRA